MSSLAKTGSLGKIRATMKGKNGKTAVLPGFCEIEHVGGSGGTRSMVL